MYNKCTTQGFVITLSGDIGGGSEMYNVTRLQKGDWRVNRVYKT